MRIVCTRCGGEGPHANAPTLATKGVCPEAVPMDALTAEKLCRRRNARVTYNDRRVDRPAVLIEVPDQRIHGEWRVASQGDTFVDAVRNAAIREGWTI